MKRSILLFCSLLALGATATAAEPKSPTPHQRYQSECSSCHMAYPASFLPARSWQKLMGNLANHFGDNAELDDATSKQITDYLLANAGDRNAANRYGARFSRSAPARETPLRITELPRFKREHHEIPQRFIRNNDKVGSLSNCAACHTRAAQGSFREREISIPGVGRWEEDD